MREILFRGKRIDTGEWVYGYPVGWQNESGDISIVDSRFGACIDADGNLMMLEAPFVAKVDPSTVGQYTGLTDKNGKKIFEGDVINAQWRSRSSAEVVFESGMFKAHGMSLITWMADPFYRCKVIGNIYEQETIIHWKKEDTDGQ